MTLLQPRGSLLVRLAIGLALFAATAAPAAASPANQTPSPAPLFGAYWSEFVDFWLGQLKQQNGVVLFALGLGAVSLFIITRGKWKK